MIICNPGIKPKNRHLQSILASSKLRLLKISKKTALTEETQQEKIETSDAVLEGFYTPTKGSNQLFILLHGWEGSSNSTYIQLLADCLITKKKASVYRLNFRDHGDTHHLNEDLFHSCRLKEVLEAIKIITELHPYKEVNLCGFSLGGNFSLRVSAKADEYNIEINNTFAISPPIDPKNSMLAIEKSPLYSRYFMKKWQRSLLKKQRYFPQLFDGHQFKQIKTLDKLTEMLIIRHSDYTTTDEYFADYAITDTILERIENNCHVLTSWDDPVIPFADFLALDKKKNIKLVTTKHGGHCGFINSWSLSSWIEHYILENS